MQKLEIIIRLSMADDVLAVLGEAGFIELSKEQVTGCGNQKGLTGLYGGPKSLHLRPKVKLEAVIPDDKLETVLEKIRVVSQTGELGDGKIFVYPVEPAVMIRTGDKSEVSL